MIRIVRLSETYYGLDMGEVDHHNIEKCFEDFKNFIDSGDPVLLLNDIDEIEYFIDGMTADDVTMVEKK